MGYDSIKKRVVDYSKKKTDVDEEDSILRQDEWQLDSIIQGAFTLDSDLQSKINSIRREYVAERSRIDATKSELESEKKEISNTISSELGKLSEADGKLSRIETMKYGKEAERAKKKCEEYMSQLEGLLGEIDSERKSNSSCDSQRNTTLDSRPEASNNDSLNVKDNNQFENNTNTLYGNGKFVPLSITTQTSQTMYYNGRMVDVFDHPFEPNNYRICNQGSAYPSGPQGTCGCCSCGTIINKAGGNTNEREVVAYAWNSKPKLCSNSGGTSPSSWVGILGGAGIDSKDTSGTSLSDLANLVERGHGVIIGVSACTYCPQMYGRYFPRVSDGHALVLESVVRDHKTGEIVEYVVSDSNGKTRDDACHRVPVKVLEAAFARKQRVSVVTNNVIW